jgi:hypothetical protein
MKAHGYAEETTTRPGVFALPEPRFEPVPWPARCALDWAGTSSAETGIAFERGRLLPVACCPLPTLEAAE